MCVFFLLKPYHKGQQKCKLSNLRVRTNGVALPHHPKFTLVKVVHEKHEKKIQTFTFDSPQFCKLLSNKDEKYLISYNILTFDSKAASFSHCLFTWGILNFKNSQSNAVCLALLYRGNYKELHPNRYTCRLQKESSFSACILDCIA